MREGRSSHRVIGLDVGTTKICALVGSMTNGRPVIEAVGTAPSHGLRKGIVVDMEVTADSIKRAISDIKSFCRGETPPVFVGIAGGHIKSFEGYGAVDIRGNVVGDDDIEMLKDAASAVYVPVDREILHMIPAGFRLDGRNSIKDPVGLPGKRLESRFHMVTGSVTHVQNLVRCCEMAHLSVADIVLEPLASADAVLRTDEKDEGVALVDIGGGTTDVAVYSDGMLRMTSVLALGGNHLTNDIAVVLRVSVAEAEEMKKRHGRAIAAGGDGTVPSNGASLDRRRSGMTQADLIGIVQPRCEEMISLVKREIMNLTSSPVAGIVLTGGTALLNGLPLLAEKIFDLPVRIGVPTDTGSREEVNSPEYATGVGLVRYGLESQATDRREEDEEALSSPGGIFVRMKEWAQEFIK